MTDHATKLRLRAIGQIIGQRLLVRRAQQANLDEFVIAQRLIHGGDYRLADAVLRHLHQRPQGVGTAAQEAPLEALEVSRFGHRSENGRQGLNSAPVVTRHFPHPQARGVTGALAALCVMSCLACAVPPVAPQPRLTLDPVPTALGPPALTPSPALRPILDVAPAEESSLVLARRILQERAPVLDELAREGVARVLVNAEAKRGLPVLMMLALIEQESSFNPRAIGPRGSLGLMQIRPFVGRDLCARNGYVWQGDRTLFDPVQNVRLGTTFLAELRDAFDDVDLALTAYNMGPTRLRRLLNRGQMPRGTYVRKVQERYHALRSSYGDAETAVGG